VRLHDRPSVVGPGALLRSKRRTWHFSANRTTLPRPVSKASIPATRKRLWVTSLLSALTAIRVLQSVIRDAIIEGQTESVALALWEAAIQNSGVAQLW
jgi:hypothetical protein